MSVKVMARVWAQSSRKDGELLVMLALADFSNDLGECWPGLDTLAQKARLTKSQVCRVLKNLEEIGEIRRARSRGGKSGRTHYFILSQDNSVILRQSQYNSVLDATCTVAPMRQCNTTHTRNRHRTVNKNTEPDGSNSLPHREKKGRSSSPDPIQAEALAGFYEAYPRHVGKAEAEKAWMKLDPNPELRAKIMIGTRRYAEEVRDVEPRFIKHPGPWLNARRWEDEPATGSPKQQQSSMRNIG